MYSKIQKIGMNLYSTLQESTHYEFLEITHKVF